MEAPVISLMLSVGIECEKRRSKVAKAVKREREVKARRRNGFFFCIGIFDFVFL